MKPLLNHLLTQRAGGILLWSPFDDEPIKIGDAVCRSLELVWDGNRHYDAVVVENMVTASVPSDSDPITDWLSQEIPDSIRRPWHVFEHEMEELLEKDDGKAKILLRDIEKDGSARTVFLRSCDENSQGDYAQVSVEDLAAFVAWKNSNPTNKSKKNTTWDDMSDDEKADWVPSGPRESLARHPKWMRLIAEGPPPCGPAMPAPSLPADDEQVLDGANDVLELEERDGEEEVPAIDAAKNDGHGNNAGADEAGRHPAEEEEEEHGAADEDVDGANQLRGREERDGEEEVQVPAIDGPKNEGPGDNAGAGEAEQHPPGEEHSAADEAVDGANALRGQEERDGEEEVLAIDVAKNDGLENNAGADEAGGHPAEEEHGAADEAVGGANEGAPSEPVGHKKRKHTADDVDVSTVLRSKVFDLYALRASLRELMTAEDWKAAALKKEEINSLVKDITSLPLCMFCFTEAPSANVRSKKLCIESWRYLCGKLHCSFCGQHATGNGSEAHMVQMRQSLRRRVAWQLDEALSELPRSCAPGRKKKLEDAIKQLKVRPGQGKGIKGAIKTQTVASLVGQMHMTLERLDLEDGLERERMVLLLALRCLEVSTLG